MMTRLLSILLALLLPVACVAQQQAKPADYGIKSKKALEYYEMAVLAQRMKKYTDVIGLTEQALLLEPNFAHAHYQRGLAYYYRSLPMNPDTQGDADKKKAVEHFDKVLALKPAEFPEVYFKIAELQIELQNYAAATERLNAYLQLPKQSETNRRIATDILAKADFALKARQNPIKFEPQNLGTLVNTPQKEYMPNVTADEGLLFFTSRREGCLGGYDRMQKDWAEDFYVSQKQANGQWGPAVNLGPPVNTTDSEGAASFSQDGQWVYFTACNRRDGEGDCDIYVARIVGANWSEPLNMSPVINSPHFDSQPCISPDGRKLYYVSTRPGGVGGSDLWVAEQREDGAWTMPRNMGPTINTPGDEYYPFLAADGKTLYFSSNYHPGLGGLDLFMSKLQDNGAWGKPVNLGFPLNTQQDEHALVVNAAGTHGYLGTTREGGLGKSDIWRFELDPRIRPEPGTYVRGKVLDSLTGKPIGAEVVMLNLTNGSTTRSVESNSATGQFLLSLPLEQDYAAFVEAEGYLFYSKNFSLKGVQGQRYYDLTIRLQPIQAGATVRLDNVFFSFDKSDLKTESYLELNKLVELMQANPTLSVEIRGHTDSEGADAYNLTLSDSRAKAVMDYVVSKGIPVDRLKAKGYGETQPLSTNDTEAGRALNRRTEFRILTK